ncbi:MAG: hypothetical protein FWC16_12280 [Defluviitaleaceae bacterium]|nr:hypothetical protein [Defluviitaleaceae bacterium]MCL2275697.1 hypothetical protein [Defluviitaleaceae bacterium]
MTTLEQAQALVDRLYEMTSALDYTGEEENEEAEIAAYIALVDAREPLVKELTALHSTLDTGILSSTEFAEIKKCIADIADMDRSHTMYFTQLQDELRGSIREIKKGRQINSAYNVDVNYDDAAYVDTKK